MPLIFEYKAFIRLRRINHLHHYGDGLDLIQNSLYAFSEFSFAGILIRLECSLHQFPYKPP